MNKDTKNIEKIFGKVTKIEASYEVFASAKYYPHFIKVFIPNDPYRKMIPFMEEIKDEIDTEDWKSRVIDSTKTSNETHLERSIRRTRTLISDYSLCNEFELMATFTFSPKKTRDRYNPDLIKSQMNNWLKNEKTRKGNFPYLIVPEFHKDGKALHFHALIKDYPGRLTDSGKRINGRKAYNFKSYTLGINSAVKIDSTEKVSSYVMKYITKDMPLFHAKHRFWATKGLEKPKVVDNPSDWYLKHKPLRTYANEYGRLLYFDIRKGERNEEI
jgi:hypothetical protein